MIKHEGHFEQLQAKHDITPLLFDQKPSIHMLFASREKKNQESQVQKKPNNTDSCPVAYITSPSSRAGGL